MKNIEYIGKTEEELLFNIEIILDKFASSEDKLSNSLSVRNNILNNYTHRIYKHRFNEALMEDKEKTLMKISNKEHYDRVSKYFDEMIKREFKLKDTYYIDLNNEDLFKIFSHKEVIDHKLNLLLFKQVKKY